MSGRLLLLLAMLALPSLGATSLEVLRANSRAARDEVSALRAQQLQQRGELSALSTRIEDLKGTSKGALLPGGELDAALKRSQELSGALGTLAQQVTSRESALEAANMALLDGLSSELTRLRGTFDRLTDRTARADVLGQMRRLRTERDALRQTLPSARVPSVDSLRASDDPEEMLEQADLLRDREEKLRRELKALDARIAERREEAELDRRVQRFMGEESMFDDGDRRLRVQRTVTTPGELPTKAQSQTGVGSPPPVNVSDSRSGFTDTTAGTGTLNTSPQGGGQYFPASTQEVNYAVTPPARGVDSAGGGLDAASLRITNASDARVQVGGGRALQGGDDGLDELEVERTRLQGLANQLQKKANELQQRAAQLE